MGTTYESGLSEMREGLCLAAAGVRRPRMLVPVDCSDFAASVVDVAACTARLMQAEVHLLAIVPPERSTLAPLASDAVYSSAEAEVWPMARRATDVIATPDQMAAAERDAADDYLHLAVNRFRGLAVKTAVRFRSSVAEAVIEYAREVGADLIAMPTHGRGRLAQAVLGSAAAEVVHSGVAPCLLVKPREL
jgi:nucleotide-binding universal stress UspA family protein